MADKKTEKELLKELAEIAKKKKKSIIKMTIK